MLLEQALEVIEYTDSDHYAEAIDVFNRNHLVNGNMLPFLDVIFDIAPVQLCQQLKSVGFNGEVAISKATSGSYVVYNAQQITEQEAVDKVSL
ncbi:hypothetical protein P7F88_21635 [Vibrio hannami]|uniref:hypothetical protein n=1 Tax=Vibrio hannami TaxID=2717094 RepID=UPI00240F4190|nr:hypothetical protein [Vibrio hannami]MDG3088524.1 hypothetical protein [Vibrio hannami]